MTRTINLKTKKEIWSERQKEENDKESGMEEGSSLSGKESFQGPADGQNHQIFEWSAYEFIKHKKNPNWFLFGGFFAILLLLVAIFTKNYIFAVIVVLSSFLIYVWGQKEPRKHKFRISPKGITIGKTVYNFENLKSFWIFYDPPEIQYLSIESKKIFMPRISIPLDNADPNRIREALADFLPEEEHEESLIDVLGRYLRF